MARRSTVRGVEEFILFDVLYEDGTRTSNRKIPGGRSARLTAALKGSQGKRAKVVRDLVEKVIIAEDKDQNRYALTARSQGVRVDPLVSVRRSCPTTWRAASRSTIDQFGRTGDRQGARRGNVPARMSSKFA